jgi:hypothetical protein
VTIYVTIISHYYNQRAIVINLGNHLLSHCDVPRLWVCAAADLVAGAAAVNLVAGAGTGDMVGRRQSLLLKNHHIFKKQGEDPHAGVSAKHNVCTSLQLL